MPLASQLAIYRLEVRSHLRELLAQDGPSSRAASFTLVHMGDRAPTGVAVIYSVAAAYPWIAKLAQ